MIFYSFVSAILNPGFWGALGSLSASADLSSPYGR